MAGGCFRPNSPVRLPPEPRHRRDDRIPGERSSRPTASRRCLCHGFSCLAAAGGRLLRPGDAQAGSVVPAASAALLLLYGIGRSLAPQERSSGLDRPGDRNARRAIAGIVEPLATPLPRLQQPRRPRGRDRTVIDELCARHNRPRPTNDRQLARPRSPQDDRQERTRGRHPPSHSDWRCGKRVNPPAVGPPEASSVALTSRLGQRPSVFRVPLLLGGRPIGSRRPLPRRAPAHSAMHDARRGRQRTGACSSPASVGWTRSCATSPLRSSAPRRREHECDRASDCRRRFPAG